MRFVLKRPDGTESVLSRDDLVMLYNQREINNDTPARREGENQWGSVGPLLGISPAKSAGTVPRVSAESGATGGHFAQVVVTDIKMTFGSMVVFMIKWALATIPALIILAIIYFAFAAIFLGGCAAVMMRVR